MFKMIEIIRYMPESRLTQLADNQYFISNKAET